MAEVLTIDGRDMEPPEPLERTLEALASLPPGGEVVLRVNCEPVPLYGILDRSGYVHSSQRQPDGSNEVRIRKG